MTAATLMRSSAVQFVVVAAVLGAVASLAPAPWYPTDRDTYEQVGREILVPDCSSLHCFRILVPAILERLPGPSLIKWKAYAVLANAGAAVAVGRLVLHFGASPTASLLAVWMSALGFGSLFTLFDPHTADPLMFLIGPLLTMFLLRGQAGRAGLVSAAGVFAKEFAAAPLWIAATVAALQRRRWAAISLIVMAAAVTTLWVVFQLVLITAFDYSYGNSESTRLLDGGYLVYWVREVGVRTAISSLLTEFGALYLLVPVGWVLTSRELRQWAVASIPAALPFVYVQQPDRALWNFHFVAIPLAAIVVAGLPRIGGWLFVAAYALANLRLGAQLSVVPAARYALAVSLLLAAVAIVRSAAALRRGGSPEAATRDEPRPINRLTVGALATVTAVVMIGSAALMADLALHNRTQEAGGVNKWGYRGPVAKRKQPNERRVVVLGGSLTYGSGVQWDQSFPAYLQRNLRQGWRKLSVATPITVVNLATPHDDSRAFQQTLIDYDYLAPDIVVLVAEDGAQSGRGDHTTWRRQSAVFRATGYLPILPMAIRDGFGASSNGDQRAGIGLFPEVAAAVPVGERGADDQRCDASCDAVLATVGDVLGRDRQIVVVVPPFRTRTDVERERVLGAALNAQYGDNPRVGYLNLGTLFEPSDRHASIDGVHPTPAGHDQIAERLTDPILEMTRR